MNEIIGQCPRCKGSLTDGHKCGDMLAPIDDVMREIMSERINADALISGQFDAVAALRRENRELKAVNKGLVKQLRELRAQQRQPKGRKLAIAGRG